MIILEFEQEVFALDARIEELQRMTERGLDLAREVVKIRKKREMMLKNIYSRLTPWQKVQVARHPDRPQGKDFLQHLVQDFTPLAGDRFFGEDAALVGGVGRFSSIPVMVLVIHRGHDTEERLAHNFGMAQPEGYRKAQRLMDLAQKFALPLLTFVDTSGAYPGIGAEERGQAEAIARCTEKMLALEVPTIAVITGEGGSGGAVALSVADRIFMLEHAVYSVISPEGCASILWRSAEKAQEAAEALHLTAQDLDKFGVIDGIIAEPLGGAHRDKGAAIEAVKQRLEEALSDLAQQPWEKVLPEREERFSRLGVDL
ncbi:MAG: acetyl-CoA carboxylase carboxyltransferase subunit alpha [Holosporales bacterium]|jgi:acetyl-CoA carboxylase carboxyl transferase subunit alpha|nr:acetyl-CoA carboxylase carboxyltransferase subunit alpha [Holosporales bacterium]